MKKYNIVSNNINLADAKAVPHQVCRVLCEAHNWNRPSVIKSSQPRRMAQHFTFKYTNSPSKIKKNSYAYPVAILRHVNLYNYFNASKTNVNYIKLNFTEKLVMFGFK